MLDGMTSLMWAVKNGHLKVATLLLDMVANVDAAMTNYGTTSLIWAANCGHLEIARLLPQ